MAANRAQLDKLGRIEALVQHVGDPGCIHRASNLAWSIAAQAQSGCIAELAQRVVTALNLNAAPDASVEYMAALHTALGSLRFALEHENKDEGVVH